jgi:hypothetical protein
VQSLAIVDAMSETDGIVFRNAECRVHNAEWRKASPWLYLNIEQEIING